jgi:MoaA/NifB/PqqE/SkfB family radical SAM enzyme
MKIIPKIPVVFKGKFPKDFINDVDGWSFPRDKLKKNKGKILTLDIDLGKTCSLNCPHCFRRDNKFKNSDVTEMSYEEVLDVVKQAKELGLESVKFLGAGEPFENPRFLEFLKELKKMQIKPLIFTKGHVIGDDELAKKYFSHEGIKNSEQLVERLKELGARILLGFNSFNTEIQDAMVGGIKGYTLKRNRALELLARAGFNKHNPTHLCIATNPVTKMNYNEIFEIYTWGRVRNLYVIVCPTMVAGRARSREFQKRITPSREKLIQLYVKIYKFNIEKGIQTLEDLKRDGISSYAGGAPCNQVACGMYVRLDGTVLRCPGDDITIFGNIRKESLKSIWFKSENFKRAGTYNCHCPPKDGKTIPKDLYTEVLKRLEEELGCS